MNDLTNTHPEIWKQSTPLLVDVISQVVQQKSFEGTTRASASEIELWSGREYRNLYGWKCYYPSNQV